MQRCKTNHTNNNAARVNMTKAVQFNKWAMLSPTCNVKEPQSTPLPNNFHAKAPLPVRMNTTMVSVGVSMLVQAASCNVHLHGPDLP